MCLYFFLLISKEVYKPDAVVNSSLNLIFNDVPLTAPSSKKMWVPDRGHVTDYVNLYTNTKQWTCFDIMTGADIHKEV